MMHTCIDKYYCAYSSCKVEDATFANNNDANAHQASKWMEEPAHAPGRVCTEKDILRNRIIVVREYCCEAAVALGSRTKCIQVFGSK